MFGRDGEDDPDDFERARHALVDGLERRESLSQRTAEAMRAVPREEFLPESQRQHAYADRPLPIGEGQTISAPHMVAIMVEALEVEPGDTVLEIGTGCGYHAAVTAEVVGAENVYTVEYFESLAREARARFDRLGYGEISVRAGNGWDGWPAHAPYDAAYLTCAAPEFPEAVVEQVRVGGHLLGPIGSRAQWLVSAEKRPDGSLDRTKMSRVRFVEMQGSP
ncbi:MAG: protein-L-isoaspartate(D-aspartate) O-methyltransferase [Halodesulfurarchaeum sp.]